MNATGTSLAYATFLGGSSDTRGSNIVVDAGGAAYVTGYTISSDFPTTPDAFETTYNGSGDDEAFIVKLNTTGSALAYSTLLGGSSMASDGTDITVDGSGAAYVTGTTDSPDFPTTPGAFDTTYHVSSDAFSLDAFVVKLNATGTSLAYATFLGGGFEDQGSSIAVDGSGAAYVTGYTNSSDFPTTPDAFGTTYNGSQPGYGMDAFVVNLNPEGAALSYSTFLGGGGPDWGYGVAMDQTRAVYVTGRTASPDFPTTPGAFDTTLNVNDVFVVKLAMGGGTGPFTGNISPVCPIDNATVTTVMQGGTAYRYFRLLGVGNNPISNATVNLSVGSPTPSDASGYFTATIPTSALGGLGSYQVSVQSVTYGGQTYSTNNQPSFGVQVTERRYSNSWSYGAERMASAGISTGLIALISGQTNGGLGLTLSESDPTRTDDDQVEMEESYSAEATSEVGLGIRQNISAAIINATLNANVTTEYQIRNLGDLKAAFAHPYDPAQQEAQGIFLALSVLDSASNSGPIQPSVVRMLQAAQARLPYLNYISEQSAGTGAKVTPIQANLGADVSLAAKTPSGSQQKGRTLGFILLDVGASRLVEATVTDYGNEYSVGFVDELSVDMTALAPSIPHVKTTLIGLIGNSARRIHKEYFFDSVSNQLTRIELTLSSEGNPLAFTDVTKKQVAIKLTLQGNGLTAALVEQVGQAKLVSDLNNLLNEVSQIPYEVTVEDGSSLSMIPELGIPGTEFKIGLGLDVEALRKLVRQRGVFLNGNSYVTESYQADAYVATPGKNWTDLTTNALGGLWLLVQDVFNWISQQVTSGIGWAMNIVARTSTGVTSGGAQLNVPSGTQLQRLSAKGIRAPLTGPITVTATSWVPASGTTNAPQRLKPSLTEF